MEEVNKSALISELPGLEAAKRLIDQRILEIHAQLRAGSEYSAPKQIKPLPLNDPTVLGYDTLGRIKRKRHLTEDQRAEKRRLMGLARKKKLDAMAEARQEVSRG